MTHKDRILIAEISSAHGIKGYVKLVYFGENVADLPDYNPLYTAEAGTQTLHVHIKNPIKGGYVAMIDGVTDRNQAEALRGTSLYVARDQFKAPEDGEYYFTDLVGCRVVEGGKEVGTVLAVDDFGAGTLLDVKPPQGGSFYIPFRGPYIMHINIENNTIEVLYSDQLR